ncbi:MAG: hypothetical protein A4E58_02215 [Syntrophorhabdus sp. PtaB.Bin006]|nr:MAG: hypothetical protein A4E58_02215 [Syntrophorhabdus sp. PtaB.Bin006]
METTVKNLKEEITRAGVKLQKAHEKLETLKRRRVETQKDMAALQRLPEELQERMNDVLDKFVMGEAPEEAVQEARGAYASASDRLQEAIELEAALNRGIAFLENSFLKGEADFQALQRSLWTAIHEEYQDELRETVRDHALKLVAAKALAGGGGVGFDGVARTLVQTFFPSGIFSEEIEGAIRQLRDEHLGGVA